MTMTRERPVTEPRVDVDRSVPEVPSPPPRPRSEGSLSDGWIRTVAVSWIAFFVALPALEPAPADPSAAPAASAVVLSTVLLGLLAFTAAGLVTRRRWALWSSLGAGVLLGGMAVACPVTGHHGFGLWWIGEMALVAAVLGVSAVGLRRA